MSKSCARFSGPPVNRTADNGSGRARSGIAFLICWASVERHTEDTTKIANENISSAGFLIVIVNLRIVLALCATTRLTRARFHCKQASALAAQYSSLISSRKDSSLWAGRFHVENYSETWSAPAPERCWQAARSERKPETSQSPIDRSPLVWLR